jgi:hypothetical protein
VVNNLPIINYPSIKQIQMPKFAIQNTEAKVSSRDVKYDSATPNAFFLATNFESPYVLNLTANEPYDIYFDKVLNQNNFFNPVGILPQITGTYLIRWSFNCLLTSGTPGQTHTATIRCLNTETFNFVPSATASTTNYFQAIISTSGFNFDGDGNMVLSITSPVNATLELTSNIVNIKYISALSAGP